MLLISDDKKIDSVIKILQPHLKLKINIERDFDCGLNDVFEKRPDVVFIQNTIAGVTGESVARHIQLLLGGMAPRFILLHAAEEQVKPIKGLYDHLIDLSQNEELIAAEMLHDLHQLFGERWHNLVSSAGASGNADSASSPRSVVSAEICPALTFDEFKDIPAVEPPPAVADADVGAAAGGGLRDEQRAEGLADEYAMLTTVDNKKGGEAAPEAEKVSLPRAVTSANDSEQYAADLSAALAAMAIPAALEADTTEEIPDLQDMTSLRGKTPQTSVELLHADAVVSPDREEMVAKDTPDIAQADDLWTFDGEPRLQQNVRSRYHFLELLLVLSLLAGGWYFFKQQPHKEPSSEVSPVAPSPQTSSNTVSAPPRSLKNDIPSFIPLVGLDPGFAAQNPGWERYIDAEMEFRLFSEKGVLKAVQIKADKDQIIPAAFLGTVLRELTGVSEYRESSREEKYGFQVVHAHVPGKAELVIYLKKSAIHAVVVALG